MVVLGDILKNQPNLKSFGFYLVEANLDGENG